MVRVIDRGFTGSVSSDQPLLRSDDTDGGSSPRGRWIPTTSVEQYAATLATWYGLSTADLPAVFPLISRFSDLTTLMADRAHVVAGYRRLRLSNTQRHSRHGTGYRPRIYRQCFL